MVENQHRKITGYRELSETEIALMNEGKALAQMVGQYLDNVAAADVPVDQRWLAIGKTDLQKGFMAVIRSIAQPTTF